MIDKSLIETLFKAFSIERWNDKLRPIAFTQIDKHSHKMMIAYCFAKYEEDAGNHVNYVDLIKAGVFELIRRTVISDIQSPVYREIAKNEELLIKLNQMIYDNLQESLGNEKLKSDFYNYLFNRSSYDPLSLRILEASNKYATYWEFNVINNIYKDGYNTAKITSDLYTELEHYTDLIGIKKIKAEHSIKRFIDLCGELRYQIRWGHLPRIPRTSVLGHVMFVASMTLFVTYEFDKPAKKRLYNDFFGALFHDLPESVTRDIIKPIKRSVEGMQEVIKKIEDQLAENEIYPLIEPNWVDEIKFFTRDEFETKLKDGTRVKSEEINSFYNSDEKSPYDGELIKLIDDFSAFMEASSSISFGIQSVELVEAKQGIYDHYKNSVIAGVPLYKLFEGFI
jgi:putative hydrolase of HD superfamily